MSLCFDFSIRKGDFSMSVKHQLDEGGITAVFGPSGCGKTSLLRALAGLDRPLSGSCEFDGQTWQSDKIFQKTHERSIGFVFQDAALFEHLNVLENIQYGFKRRSSGAADDLGKIVEILDLSILLERKINDLSGGEKQRVALARALASEPKLLLMDEPLASLDAAGRREILSYLEVLPRKTGIPIIYVSHSIEEVVRLADHLLLMERGCISASGRPVDLLTDMDLPLSKRRDAGAIIEAVSESYDEAYDLTQFSFAGSEIYVPGQLALGERFRFKISASDVSITLERHTCTSILNILPATLVELVQTEEATVIVKLVIEGVPVLSRITRKSANLLDLSCEKSVFIQIKSMALLQ